MDDYKRGLLEMMNVFISIQENGLAEVKWQGPINLTAFIQHSPSVGIALEYRNELAERAKLDEAVKLLESNGYLVSPAHLITEYKKAAEYLRKGGYTVTKPDPNAADYPPGHPLHNPHGWKPTKFGDPPSRHDPNGRIENCYGAEAIVPLPRKPVDPRNPDIVYPD